MRPSAPARPSVPSTVPIQGLARRLLLRAARVVAIGLTAAAALHLVADPYTIDIHRACSGPCQALTQRLTRFGEGWETLLPGALVILACAARRLRGVPVGERLARLGWTMAFVVASVGIGGIVAALAKYTVGRGRPFVAGADVLTLRPLEFSRDWAAFPSGHAATAGATAAVLMLLFPRRGPIALVAFGLVAASRVTAGAHFPSDVAAGFALGFAFTLLMAAAFLTRGRVFQTCGGRLWRRPVLTPPGAGG